MLKNKLRTLWSKLREEFGSSRVLVTILPEALYIKIPSGLHAGPLSWLNWNLECWFLWREVNQRTQRKHTPVEQGENQEQAQLTYGTDPESNPRPNGGR